MSVFGVLLTPLAGVSADAPTPSPSLIAWVAGQTPAAPSATALYDFGERSVSNTSPILQTFVLKSLSDKPLTVDRLQPSCRCTTAVVEGVKDEAPPFTLAPGHEARVRVIVSPSDALPGPFEKEVYVFVQGDSAPSATLQIAGVLTPPAGSH